MLKKAPENGQTGWAIIYSLREALQYELKLTELGEGFGDQTKAALAKVINTIKKNSSSKIVKLIKGAFWCKGISPNSFTESYDEDLAAAIKSLQSNAGLDADGNLTVNLMAALFDMSAFTLLENGDKRIREMQQTLNKKYSNDLGILPCDGVYQRGTNTALIYALQRVEGIDATTANGNYGAETIARTPTVSEGTTGEIVQIIQYGLYVNGFYTGAFDGSFTETVGNAIVAFRKFMHLEPYTTTADLTVIKGLLTSNGNTDRDSTAFDTATQLTSAAIAKFKNAGFEIVGRYLTGTVGTGSNERPKNLTADEITAITSAGLSIFPIYEDGGYEEKYFTNSQGTTDGGMATAAARKLGFPEGTTIYFAVDVDIQDGDIDGTVTPYLKGVLAAVADSGYEVGVYGTRNVCLYAEKIGVKYSFVANMSYGWSGNLGFKMPSNWSFDQFTEYTAGSTGIDIDQDAASGKDKGVSKFGKVTGMSAKAALKSLWPDCEYDQEVEFTMFDTKWMKITGKITTSFKKADGSTVITIKNGKVDEVSMNGFLNSLGASNNIVNDLIIDKFNTLSFTSEIKNGQLSVKSTTGSDGSYTFELAWTAFETDEGVLDEALTIALEIKINLPDFPSWGTFAEALGKIGQIAAIAVAVTGTAILIVGMLPADVVGAVVTATVTLFTTIVADLA
ncbi:ybfg like protein [Liquorilactobacillus aquaticus DSM 21051]|uniref:Ybfg like protein n=1 Tax=Liquorilactobacillus aquaticus DSM 21051 TaxID=1423725 RepID=A0A0R2D5V7_9LACO|nr:glycoside hydrolase domain-containing protein [Liquorilactobacillus aquaticus]KRM95750.1 ybfg like protein [Liquorilactobacillus aquaticus DSM 21051]